MSAKQDELITEEDAARYLGVSPVRLIELVTQGVLRLVIAKREGGLEAMYLSSEVLQLNERPGDWESKPVTEEWPDTIGE